MQSVWRKTKPQSYFVFLFNDLLIATKKPSKITSGKRCVCELALKLHECQIDYTRDGIIFSSQPLIQSFTPFSLLFFSLSLSHHIQSFFWTRSHFLNCFCSAQAAFVLHLPKKDIYYSFYCSDRTMRESWRSAILKTFETIKSSRQQYDIENTFLSTNHILSLSLTF